MPFVSASQRRKFFSLARQGKMSMATVKEWQKETGDKKLPERKKKRK